MGLVCLWRLMFFVTLMLAKWPLSWQQQQQQQSGGFAQLTDRFWSYDHESQLWKTVQLPHPLLSCQDGNCRQVGVIQKLRHAHTHAEEEKEEAPAAEEEKFSGDHGHQQGTTAADDEKREDSSGNSNSSSSVLGIRKRTSLMVVSERSVWVTGESGSIFERFWNGLHWVIAPHDLHASAGYAASLFFVNHTYLALSEAGLVCQLTIGANAQPSWIEIGPSESSVTPLHVSVEISHESLQLSSGVSSIDGKSVYFVTTNRMLMELSSLQPVKWICYGHPPGGDVAAVVDANNLRPGTIFTVSTLGELYEFDANTKPSWKKHIWSKSLTKNISLAPTKGCTFHGLVGENSASLFLISKDGQLLERQFSARRWKWLVHTMPKDVYFSALGPATKNEVSQTIFSLFLSTTTGSAYEYRIPKLSGASHSKGNTGEWVNHKEPPDAKTARSIPGVLLQNGRLIFALDDGRLGELHLSGIGGDGMGPSALNTGRRKTSSTYEWSIIEVPESEGWNAGYCTEFHGPFNCLKGVREELIQEENIYIAKKSSSKRRKGRLKPVQTEVHEGQLAEMSEDSHLERKLRMLFGLRVMEADISLFLLTDTGQTYEHLHNGNSWMWAKHDHESPMNGLLALYNGSLFVADQNGSLFIREWSDEGLVWLNCSAMDGGAQVTAGPPWDGTQGLRVATIEDSLYFVDKYGNLRRFTVALRRFTWQNCGQPKNARVAYILDQEILRYNVIFVVGSDGHLYQYNRLLNLWHEHEHTPDVLLSRMPGVTIRQSFASKSGSLFARSSEGKLVEYQWHDVTEGWKWNTHGIPEKGMKISTAPGPCFDGNQLFLVFTDGRAYSRYRDGYLWKWKDFGFPPRNLASPLPSEFVTDVSNNAGDDHCFDCKGDCPDSSSYHNHHLFSSAGSTVASPQTYHVDINCDEKIAAVRPASFSNNSVIFMLRDGRLAELRRSKGEDWKWNRIISTPHSRCQYGYVTFSPA